MNLPRKKIRQGVIAGLASFVSLAGIFVATMANLDEATDWPYLQWAIPRIAVASILLGAVVASLRQMRPILTAMAGVFGGVALGAIYVTAFANG